MRLNLNNELETRPTFASSHKSLLAHKVDRNKHKAFQDLKRLWKFVSAWRRQLLCAVSISGLLALLGLPGPFVARYVIDSVIPRSDFQTLSFIAVALLLLTLIQMVIRYLYGMLLVSIKEGILLQYRKALLWKIETLNVEFFTENNAGYLISRITNDPTKISGLLAGTMISVLTSITTFGFTLVAFLYLDISLALLALSVLPVVIVFHYRYGPKLRTGSQWCQETQAVAGGTVGETVDGIHIARLFAAEKQLFRKSTRAFISQFRANVELTRVSQVAGIASSLAGSLGALLVMFAGVWFVMSGSITLGTYLAASAFLGRMYGPAINLMMTNLGIQESLAALRRVHELLDLESEKASATIHRASVCGRSDDIIELVNVGFSYSSSSEFAIKDMCFKIGNGEH
jgi:ATP-binding cassette subfamily B protein